MLKKITSWLSPCLPRRPGSPAHRISRPARPRSRNALPATTSARRPRTRSVRCSTASIGRKSGTIAGYNYSDANKNSGIIWDEAHVPRIHQGSEGQDSGHQDGIRRHQERDRGQESVGLSQAVRRRRQEEVGFRDSEIRAAARELAAGGPADVSIGRPAERSLCRAARQSTSAKTSRRRSSRPSIGPTRRIPTWLAGADRQAPAELLYGQRMSATLARLSPDASEHLRIAARGQHIERWTTPRRSYPEGRAGYLKWRKDLKEHACPAGRRDHGGGRLWQRGHRARAGAACARNA